VPTSCLFDWNLYFSDVGFIVAAYRLRHVKEEFPRRSRLTVSICIHPLQQGLVCLGDPVKSAVVDNTGSRDAG
jgi:hypothetical protein